MEGLQVRLVGDPRLNVQLLLQVLPYEQDERPLLASVLSILYAKIERLRQERNHYRQQVATVRTEQERQRLLIKQTSEEFEEERRIWEQERALLAQQIGKWQDESEKLQRELSERTYLPQTDLSPVPLSNYRSCQLPQDKQNLPSDRGHSISVFGHGERLQGNSVGELMRKYNLSALEFKEILVRHIEEEGRLLEKLETESQRRLFQQSKKIKNYDEWMRKVKKQCHQTHSPLRPIPTPNL